MPVIREAYGELVGFTLSYALFLKPSFGLSLNLNLFDHRLAAVIATLANAVWASGLLTSRALDDRRVLQAMIA